jgi:hypothetical protein
MMFWGLLGGGCSKDIFDVTVELGSETYSADFGQRTGTVPTIACNPHYPDVCSGASVIAPNEVASAGPVTAGVTTGCDGTIDLCFAQVSARVVYPVNVLQDDGFVTAVAERSISLVRLAQVAYTVPTNTLTFDVPSVDIYVGPAGTLRETDPGVVQVGSTVAVPATTPFTTPMNLVIADGSPGRALIEQSIQAAQTFVFVLTLAPRIEAGAPVPAGAVEVDLFPQVDLGF